MSSLLKSLLIISLLTVSLFAQEVDIKISGKVTDTEGKALKAALVTLEKTKLSAKTDDKGAFSIAYEAQVGVIQSSIAAASGFSASLKGRQFSILLPQQSKVTISAYSIDGIVLYKIQTNLNAGRHQIAVPSTKAGVSLYKVASENSTIILKGFLVEKKGISTTQAMTTGVLSKKSTAAAAFNDNLIVSKSGYQDFTMSINSAYKSDISIQLKLNQANGKRLPQSGNPVESTYKGYKNELKNADNILSYQQDCGGWPKNVNRSKSGNGGNDRGTFDNGATILDLTVMAHAYKQNGDKKYLTAARKGIDFVLKAQYPSGGWPQYYPIRSGYYEHVTFNDEAMSRVLTMLQHAADRADPFDTDVLTDEQRSKLQSAIDKGVEYILKAQIMQNGKKTAWCAQHGKDDYKPKQGRAYEHPSISGSESVGVIGFLMTQPQTAEIKKAVIDAVDWFRSPNTYSMIGGKKTWFRFYDIATNKPIFSNYDGVKWVGIEYESKKKSGYSWSGGYGNGIIAYAEKVGY